MQPPMTFTATVLKRIDIVVRSPSVRRMPNTHEQHQVLDVAMLDVSPGRAERFLDAFSRASPIIARVPGYGRHELRRCVENDHRFLLLVWWDSVENHEVGFRRSPEFQEWKRLLHPFYDPFPTVQHYVPLGGG